MNFTARSTTTASETILRPTDAVVVDLAVKLIVYIRWHKTSQLVDDGRNKYWLVIAKKGCIGKKVLNTLNKQFKIIF